MVKEVYLVTDLMIPQIIDCDFSSDASEKNIE